MADKIEATLASSERLAQVQSRAEPILDYIQGSFTVPIGMEVLMFVWVQMFLDAKPAGGMTRLAAFDKYMDITRKTLETNEKIMLQQANNRTQ